MKVDLKLLRKQIRILSNMLDKPLRPVEKEVLDGTLNMLGDIYFNLKQEGLTTLIKTGNYDNKL